MRMGTVVSLMLALLYSGAAAAQATPVPATAAQETPAQEAPAERPSVQLELDAGGVWVVTIDAGPPAALLLEAPEGHRTCPRLEPGRGGEEIRIPPRCVEGISSDFRLELPEPAPSAQASLAAETIRGPRDGRLGRVTLAEADGRTFQALVALAGTGEPTLVWAGWTTLAGDAGERHGQRVDVGDVDGDGVTDVLVGVLSEATRVCGRDELPLLHRRGYDWASRTLRPVSGARPGLDPAAATDVAAATERFMPVVAAGEGSLDAAVAPWSPVAADATLVPLLEYRGASSSLGDGGDPLRNSPPGGLEDMDARTGWAEGVGGAGKLEFVTARVITTQLPARWLAVRAIDGGDATAPKTRNRVKSLLLVDGAGHSWRVALADGREERAGALTWFELPAPLEGGCVTAVVLDTWPATSAEGRRNNVTWISDLQVFGTVSLPADAAAVRAVLDDDASSVAVAVAN
jgi:hypothetical protein